MNSATLEIIKKEEEDGGCMYVCWGWGGGGDIGVRGKDGLVDCRLLACELDSVALLTLPGGCLREAMVELCLLYAVSSRAWQEKHGACGCFCGRCMFMLLCMC